MRRFVTLNLAAGLVLVTASRLAAAGEGSAAPAVPAPKPSDFYSAMPDGSWLLAGAGTYKGRDAGKEPPFGILGFSGMALDGGHRKLLLFGGGHNDYWGNEVWAWDIDKRGWQKMYEPDQFISLTLDAALKGVDNKKQPGVWLPSKRPITRHTYGSICFLEDKGLMLAGGGSTYSGPNRNKVDFWCDVGNPGGVWLNGAADIWLYGLEKNAWTYKGSGKMEGAKPDFPKGSGTATYAPDLKSAIVVSDATWLYDADKDVWTRKNAKCPGGGHSTMTYDTRRKLAYYVGRSGKELKMHSYDPARDVWAEVKTEGELPSNRDGGWGITYDSANDAVLAFGRDGLAVFDLKTSKWEKNPGKPEKAPPANEWTFNRFQYDAVNNVAFLVTGTRDWRVDVWAYRYKKPTADGAAAK